ncbi:MAG: type III polyketide synthase [Planctomycetes bacterium]|nr:type III polyketide synthase [Planctomycetota bacterium]
MSSLTRASLLGLGTAVPDRVMLQTDWIPIADRIAPSGVDRAITERLARRSGIESRHCDTADHSDAPTFYPSDPAGRGPTTLDRMERFARAARPLAARAAEMALARSATSPAQITHVVTASCTGFQAPGPDQWLIEDLSLPANARRVNVGFMGCHAAVNALAVAAALACADPQARVLVCCVEICSVHLHYGDRLDRLIANTLFSDGAAAAVVGMQVGAPVLEAFDSAIMPDTRDEMAWTIGNHGFEMTLGARVPEILQARVGPWVGSMLARHDLRASEVGGWAIHPGGPRVIEAVLASMQLPERAGAHSRDVLRSFGNMSSATLLFILDRLERDHVPRPWVGMAFGPGLAGESLLVT